MIGERDDILRRLRAVLPPRWFGDDTPILDALLDGLAVGWAWLYDALSFVTSQTRISTATGLWLDLIAHDYFGSRLFRQPGELDPALRHRIQRELSRERGTRAAVVAVVTDLTGRAPIVFEPGRPADTGVWGFGAGYGVAGGWGNLSLPFQCFVTAYRPHGNGIAEVAGWGSATGGYGRGAIEYASLAMSQGQVTDADIDDAIASVLPAASIAWTRVTN